MRSARAPTVSSTAKAISAIRPNWANETPAPAMCASRNCAARRAAWRRFQPAQVSRALRASVRRVLEDCICLLTGICIYIICIYMGSAMTTYSYGLARPDQVSGKSGKEILQAIIKGDLPQAPISDALSFWITEVGDGFAVFEGEPGRHLLNPMDTVHGGWALTLIDSVAGCAGHSLLPVGAGYTTI